MLLISSFRGYREPAPRHAQRLEGQGTAAQAAPTTIEVTNNFNLQGTTVVAADVAREVERTVFQSVAGRASG